MTGTISMRYLRGTPLGPLHTEARIERVRGVKAYAIGHIADAEGRCRLGCLHRAAMGPHLSRFRRDRRQNRGRSATADG